MSPVVTNPLSPHEGRWFLSVVHLPLQYRSCGSDPILFQVPVVCKLSLARNSTYVYR
jgi:hypothetical protein